MEATAPLIEKIQVYDPDVDTDLIERAYDFAAHAHGTQMRASGEPYITHPLEIAEMLTEYKLSCASIITALLHDTVEDTFVTLDEIEKEFGEEIRGLVDGVTKLTQLEGKSENMKQAENFRKLFLAMSEDIRVLLVKLADRLHNMRTLKYIKNPEKRQRIARETVEIYAALAERIGMRHAKEELQDLAFAELYPEARNSIVMRLDFLREQGQSLVNDTVKTIEKMLIDAKVEGAEIIGREKKPYSIWKKMEMKNVSFEQLADIIAFRIVVDDISGCYQALGAIHANYHTVPGHFKDYISTPKSNGYQSLHTAVIGPNKQRIEIQIRTNEMHDIAEYGVAAHWTYKQRGGGDGAHHAHGGGENEFSLHEGKQFRWVRELLEILDTADNAEEFLENTKLEMYQDQVFCFSPKGDIIALPSGSSPVDFAYSIHSAIGDTCVGAKVNGRIVPLRAKLQNGDQVEIITSKTQTPSPSWERFVVTGKARAEIRKFVRTQQRDEYINLGKAILTKTFKAEGAELTEKMLSEALETLGKKELDDVYAEVGEGLMSRQQVLDAIIKRPNQKKSGSVINKLTNPLTRKKRSGAAPMPIKGLIPGMAIHFAKCCHPIAGDKIVGIVTTGKGITIHTTDCDTLENYSDTPERWIDVAWDLKEQTPNIARLRAYLSHEPAALATITQVIARESGNISNLKIVQRSSDFFELLMDVEVRDIRHLNNIIAGLRSKECVQSVERYSS